MTALVASPRLRPTPPLGQHFLFDRRILDRIVEAVEPVPDDVVIEIGAGPGTLTGALAERVGRVIAIEKDRRLAEQLREEASRRWERVQVVTGDALRLDWHALMSEDPLWQAARPFKIVGNIPYYITSPLIDKALTAPLPERVVLLVQAEVADRLAAGPGSKTYGALSVGVQSVCRVERLFAVPAGAFRPPPRVQSAVIRLRPRLAPLVPAGSVKPYRRFVTAIFSQRRKQLRNALRAASGRSQADVDAQLVALGFPGSCRPETLAPEDFVKLASLAGEGSIVK